MFAHPVLQVWNSTQRLVDALALSSANTSMKKGVAQPVRLRAVPSVRMEGTENVRFAPTLRFFQILTGSASLVRLLDAQSARQDLRPDVKGAKTLLCRLSTECVYVLSDIP